MKHGRPDYNRRIQDSEGLIPGDEPVFLIRGHDQTAPTAVRAYAQTVTQLGGDPRVVQRALDQADAMEVYQRSHKTKMPD
jgi:hypothetical protein